MKDDQPAWKLSVKDETRNGEAVKTLLSRSAPAPKRIVEFFGGIGGVTRVAREMYPCTPLITWDKDDRCVETLREIEGVEVIQGDSLEEALVKEGDGVLMDFNLWTLLRARSVYKGVMERVFASRPTWVQVADSSLGKLHLNYASYGLESKDPEGYYGEVKKWVRELGFALVDREKAHHKTVMLLFLPIAKKSPRSKRPGASKALAPVSLLSPSSPIKRRRES